MSDKLKPCPFCNGTPKLIVKEQRFFGTRNDGTKDILLGFYIRCNRCYARGGVFTLYTNDRSDEIGIDGAIENWNKRTSE